MTATHANLKLVREPEHVDVIPLERRCSLRRSTGGQVTVVQQAGDDADAPGRIGSIQLVDISDTGLGGLSSAPLAEDAWVQLMFPPHGGEPGFEAYGQVVRCRSNNDAYNVGIRLARRVQAA